MMYRKSFQTLGLMLVLSLMAGFAYAQVGAVVVGGPQLVPMGDVPAGTNDHPTARFTMAVTNMVATDFTELEVAVAGTATSADVTNFHLYVDADFSGTVSPGDTLLASGGIVGGTVTFTGFVDAIPMVGGGPSVMAQHYLITADVSSTAAVGATFALSFTPADVTVDPGSQTVMGQAIVGLEQTVTAALPPAGPATQLAVAVQPAGAQAGVEFATQPVIEVRDAAGILVSSDNTTQVTVTLITIGGAPGAVLGGTTTETAVNGVVAFTDLSIDQMGVYRLEFEDTTAALSGVTSNSLRVTRADPAVPIACTATSGLGGWMTLLGALGALGVAARLRRRTAA
jgi:hypothetical protein